MVYSTEEKKEGENYWIKEVTITELSLSETLILTNVKEIETPTILFTTLNSLTQGQLYSDEDTEWTDSSSNKFITMYKTYGCNVWIVNCKEKTRGYDIKATNVTFSSFRLNEWNAHFWNFLESTFASDKPLCVIFTLDSFLTNGFDKDSDSYSSKEVDYMPLSKPFQINLPQDYFQKTFQKWMSLYESVSVEKKLKLKDYKSYLQRVIPVLNDHWNTMDLERTQLSFQGIGKELLEFEIYSAEKGCPILGVNLVNRFLWIDLFRRRFVGFNPKKQRGYSSTNARSAGKCLANFQYYQNHYANLLDGPQCILNWGNGLALTVDKQDVRLDSAFIVKALPFDGRPEQQWKIESNGLISCQDLLFDCCGFRFFFFFELYTYLKKKNTIHNCVPFIVYNPICCPSSLSLVNQSGFDRTFGFFEVFGNSNESFVSSFARAKTEGYYALVVAMDKDNYTQLQIQNRNRATLVNRGMEEKDQECSENEELFADDGDKEDNSEKSEKVALHFETVQKCRQQHGFRQIESFRDDFGFELALTIFQQRFFLTAPYLPNQELWLIDCSFLAPPMRWLFFSWAKATTLHVHLKQTSLFDALVHPTRDRDSDNNNNSDSGKNSNIKNDNHYSKPPKTLPEYPKMLSFFFFY
ncbi:hypothetical protein RFI_08930, partial [Reticulomyxa filosa]